MASSSTIVGPEEASGRRRAIQAGEAAQGRNGEDGATQIAASREGSRRQGSRENRAIVTAQGHQSGSEMLTMEREVASERIAREMVEQYGRSAAIIADQYAQSYIATGDFCESRQWLDIAAAIRRSATCSPEVPSA